MKSFKGRPDAQAPQREIVALYDRPVNAYDLRADLTESRPRRRALDLAEISDGQRIPEVVVGTGVAFPEIAAKTGISLTQVLTSRNMLLATSQRLKKLSGAKYILTVGTTYSLPPKGRSIDPL